MPNFPGTVINGKWYAQSPYGATNASGGVNVAPYGPWNGMPAGGITPVIGTPTTFTTGGAYNGMPVGSPSGSPAASSPPNLTSLPTIPTGGSSPGSSTPTSNAILEQNLGPVDPNFRAAYLNPNSGIPISAGYTGYTGGGSPTTVGSPTIAGSTTGATGSFGTGPYQPGASPNLESISQLVNQINLNAQQQSNAGRVPGGQAVENLLMGNTAQLAQGQLPSDVISQIQQQAAERGVSTGNSDYLRALGLNSLQAQQTAQGNLSAADARNPGAPIFDPTTQLLTPGQAGTLNNQLGIANAELALQWYKALYGNQGGVGRTPSGGTGSADTTSALPSWFQGLMAGTPSTGSITPPASGVGFTNDPIYPGTSLPGHPNLSTLLGTPDPGYGLSPDPYGQVPYGTGTDASNPNYWNFLNPAGTNIIPTDQFSMYPTG